MNRKQSCLLIFIAAGVVFSGGPRAAARVRGSVEVGMPVSPSINYGGEWRTYRLHVPTGYHPGRRYPLMIAFHGHNGLDLTMERKSGYDGLADKYGFFVVYPNARQGNWQLWGRRNDLGFTRALIRVIERDYPIDKSRVYVSGFSQGGGMAQAMACTQAETIAGMADVAANMSPAMARRCHLARPVSVVIFHGTADPVSYYNGGNYKGGNTYSARETARFWARADRCPARPEITRVPDTLSDGSKVTDTREVWSGCARGTSVTFYTIDGGGHSWPGQPSWKKKYGPVSRGLNASAIIWTTLNQGESAHLRRE